ncbi:hypothetical protein TGS27_2416 [Geobacillus stearothermophilus]|nr:hypothetical protein TGS27_2416 [Geobacillus stearothermophilus]
MINLRIGRKSAAFLRYAALIVYIGAFFGSLIGKMKIFCR